MTWHALKSLPKTVPGPPVLSIDLLMGLWKTGQAKSVFVYDGFHRVQRYPIAFIVNWPASQLSNYISRGAIRVGVDRVAASQQPPLLPSSTSTRKEKKP